MAPTFAVLLGVCVLCVILLEVYGGGFLAAIGVRPAIVHVVALLICSFAAYAIVKVRTRERERERGRDGVLFFLSLSSPLLYAISPSFTTHSVLYTMTETGDATPKAEERHDNRAHRLRFGRLVRNLIPLGIFHCGFPLGIFHCDFSTPPLCTVENTLFKIFTVWDFHCGVKNFTGYFTVFHHH
jgi:hypothetical protein